jgi:acyl-CoA synthetase (AMP-forming)/AMP-acid ligase II
MNLHLIERLAEHGRQMPHASALVQLPAGRTWTWKDLNSATAAVAARLRERAPATTVMLCGANEPAFVAAFLGALAAGCQVFPVSPQSPAAELQALAETAGATAVIGHRPALDALGVGRIAIDLKSVVPNDSSAVIGTAGDISTSALLLHSSGSTGRPKIVRRGAAALDAVSASISRAIGFTRDDHIYAAAPVCHSFGLEHGLLAAVWAGSCAHLCETFDAQAAMQALGSSMTIFPGVPFMFEILSQSRGGAGRLRRAYSAGGPLGRQAAVEFEKRFGVAVGQVYGTTEVGSATFSDPLADNFNPAGVGRAMPNVSIVIDEQSGEVLVRSASMFDGYLGATPDVPPITLEGFYRTGDVGRFDEAGNLILTGRLKLMVDVGGRKVNPLEVEGVLSDHPSVGNCVVIPLELSPGVTRLKALVTPRTAGREPSPQELRQFVKQRLAPYKVPREIEVRRELPCSPAGKVLRDQVQG